MRRLIGLSLAIALVCVFGGAGHAAPHAAPAHNQGSAGTSGYALIAWSELGMHCMDGKDYRVFSVLPPYNTIHAQLIKKGEPPVAITTGVTIA